MSAPRCASTPAVGVVAPAEDVGWLQDFINLHVDECLRRQEAATSNHAAVGRSKGAAATGMAQAGGKRGAAKKLEVPPKLAAHLLSERQLREQLRRYELPSIGKKEVPY